MQCGRSDTVGLPSNGLKGHTASLSLSRNYRLVNKPRLVSLRMWCLPYGERQSKREGRRKRKRERDRERLQFISAKVTDM